jgi:hypothetical protein
VKTNTLNGGLSISEIRIERIIPAVSTAFARRKISAAGLLSGRSGDSAERRHFESDRRRSADAPLRAKVEPPHVGCYGFSTIQ